MKTQDNLTRAINWCRREYARRRADEHCHCSHTAAAVMADAEKQFELGTFGVEGFADTLDSGLQYLNTGDTYARTILFRAMSRNFGRWSLGSWGDVAERMVR